MRQDVISNNVESVESNVLISHAVTSCSITAVWYHDIAIRCDGCVNEWEGATKNLMNRWLPVKKIETA